MEEAKSYKKYLKGLTATSGKGSKNIKIRKLIGIADGPSYSRTYSRKISNKKRMGGAMLKAKALTKKSSKDILNKLEGFKGAISDKEREALGLKKGTYSKDSKTGQILKIGRNKGGAMLKNPKKADLDKDGKLSGYEKKRGMAIEKAMSGKKFGGAMKNKPMKAVLGAIALGAAGALGAKNVKEKKKQLLILVKDLLEQGLGNLAEQKKKDDG